jgi:hypothetical protein
MIKKKKKKTNEADNNQVVTFVSAYSNYEKTKPLVSAYCFCHAPRWGGGEACLPCFSSPL